MVTDPGRSIRIAHFFENGCGERIFADVVKRADSGMAFHIRLAGENEDLERLSLR